MPSKAYTSFKSNLKQVDKLLEAFVTMRPPTRGRKHLDHFTRAALLFLCSSWEVYVEEIANQSGKIISARLTTPDNLPQNVKKTLSLAVKNHKNELSPVVFADDWKGFYLSQIAGYTNALNTPKKDKVIELFTKYLGVNEEDFKTKIPHLENINSIIVARGEIAHNIYAEAYLKKEIVDDYICTIDAAVEEIELYLWEYLPNITNGKRPWQNTY